MIVAYMVDEGADGGDLLAADAPGVLECWLVGMPNH